MLEIRDISFSYEPDKAAVSNFSLDVEAGKHIALIGESGSGKSTILKLLYGHYDLSAGTIVYNGDAITGPKFNLIPGDARFKYLAQDFGLMPYITAAENVGNFLSNSYKDRKSQRISELLELVEMTEFANVKPKFLSGGQQQRIALAKTLALEPEVVLLDEPFSQIGASLASSLKRDLFGYFKQNGISCIVATHDGNDVLAYADQAVIMKEGSIVENDRPKTIYANPASKYIASLFGEINEIPMHFFSAGQDSVRLVYPHQLKIGGSGLRAIVKKSYFQGNHYLIKAEYEGGTLFFENRVPIMENEGVFLALSV